MTAANAGSKSWMVSALPTAQTPSHVHCTWCVLLRTCTGAQAVLQHPSSSPSQQQHLLTRYLPIVCAPSGTAAAPRAATLRCLSWPWVLWPAGTTVLTGPHGCARSCARWITTPSATPAQSCAAQHTSHCQDLSGLLQCCLHPSSPHW